MILIDLNKGFAKNNSEGMANTKNFIPSAQNHCYLRRKIRGLAQTEGILNTRRKTSPLYQYFSINFLSMIAIQFLKKNCNHGR